MTVVEFDETGAIIEDSWEVLCGRVEDMFKVSCASYDRRITVLEDALKEIQSAEGPTVRLRLIAKTALNKPWY